MPTSESKKIRAGPEQNSRGGKIAKPADGEKQHGYADGQTPERVFRRGDPAYGRTPVVASKFVWERGRGVPGEV